MTPEESNEQLSKARALKNEEPEEALRLVNSVIDVEGSLDAHRLRLEILVPNFEHPGYLRASLDALMGSTTYDSDRAHLEERLYTRLADLQDEVAKASKRTEAQAHLNIIDDLLILGDLFPTVHLVRGLAYMTAARLSHGPRNEPKESPYDNLRRLLTHQLGNRQPDQTKQPAELAPQQIEWNAIAEAAFLEAVKGFSPEHPLLGETYEVLGSFYEKNQSRVKALAAYEKALQHGRPIQSTIDQLTLLAAHQAQRRILEHVDALLGAQRLDEAAEVLTTYQPDPITKAWRVRLAELAMLRGDAAEAASHYRHLLEPVSTSNQDDTSLWEFLALKGK